MAVNQEFWIVAAGCSKGESGGYGKEKDAFLAALKGNSATAPRGRGPHEDGPWKFDVPDGERSLLFGSFDNLIRLTDDLQKYDGQVDGILHRLERQYLELDPKADFKVKSQRTEKPFLEYLRNWQWDEAKYPRTRSIVDNITLLMSVVNKLDEEARNKTAQYNEFKTQKGNLAKKDSAMLGSLDLVDVLTPDAVRVNGSADDDFIYTDHLTTVCVILPRGGDVEFLKCYETLAENIVPMSARRFPKLDDKDGSMLWRVVMFKSAAEPFKKACRERRYITRDFEYSEDGYKKLKVQREQLDEAVKRQHELVRGLYQAAWSDAMVAWIHIKAMRVFVESVLRFGMPPRFASFILTPKVNNQTGARKALADILGKSGTAGPYGDKMADAAQDEGEEYYPYVSFSFTPFNVPRS
uniref:V-type proton ATPase subunit C n=1 Tax=Strombidinopsis acuminata TaxID=141414 RepID=A0A7S3SNY3_9SPIT|mmetsp:Transcript_55065/g.141782  ORF Transcript_55065/g.141782 Transcript_55065/m.141782 type:complete len:410 (-) Transcript_55065:289-1518(-)